MKKALLFVIAVFVLIPFYKAQQVWNYGYTGSQQSITLQPGNYRFETWGAQGGANSANIAQGGAGGYAVGEFSLTITTTFSIYVGGQNGYNGGGIGGNTGCPTCLGGNGGGASDIRISGNNFSDRVIVAGGGGGAGGNRVGGQGRGTGGGGGGGYYGGGGGSAWP